MRRYTFSIVITADSWAEYYRKPSSSVVATTATGQTIRFQARHLHRHISHEGVRGIFCLTIDNNNDFVSLERV